jgi:hypothetical protein
LEAAVRLETEPVRRGSEGGDSGPATGVQEGEGKMVRELRRGDVVLMLLLARKKGWNFGSTRNRTAAESEIRRRNVLGYTCTGGNEMRRCWWSMKLERRSGGGG